MHIEKKEEVDQQYRHRRKCPLLALSIPSELWPDYLIILFQHKPPRRNHFAVESSENSTINPLDTCRTDFIDLNISMVPFLLCHNAKTHHNEKDSYSYSLTVVKETTSDNGHVQSQQSRNSLWLLYYTLVTKEKKLKKFSFYHQRKIVL